MPPRTTRAIGAGALDRRLQFRRASPVDDGLGVSEMWADHGLPIWGSRSDVSDAEKAASDTISATVLSRFLVRRSAFSEGLTPKDRFTCDRLEWSVTGVKEPQQRGFLELTAVAGTD